MINLSEVIETNRMILEENLDVRTITMGISLLDCAGSSLAKTCAAIEAKLMRLAGKLVRTGDDIGREFGVPVVNKRISVTPAAIVGSACCRRPADFVKIAKTLDRASVNVGSTKTGIDMDAVRLMGEIVKATAERTRKRGSIGCAKLVVLCNAPDDNPFMAGAFHGVTEGDAVLHVGVSGPGVVHRVLAGSCRGVDFETLCETVKRTAFKITRVGQIVAQEAAKRLGVPFGIVDLSLAPTPAVGDSVADILKEIGVEHPGAPGTTAALALLNDQVKKGGVMASSYVGGLSGAFIPVSEDQGMIDAVRAGALSIEKLEAMTCVCSVGLDMIAVPGSTSASTIAGVIADEAAIGMVNQKTTAVRIIPVAGRKVGDFVEFGGLLGGAPVMKVSPFSCERFVARRGRIPAPIHSFRN